MDDPAHRHEFKFYARVDGCHFALHADRCACGQERLVRVEREVSDPWTPAFVEKDCPDCRELMAGNEPDFWKHDEDPRPPL